MRRLFLPNATVERDYSPQDPKQKKVAWKAHLRTCSCCRGRLKFMVSNYASNEDPSVRHRITCEKQRLQVDGDSRVFYRRCLNCVPSRPHPPHRRSRPRPCPSPELGPEIPSSFPPSHRAKFESDCKGERQTSNGGKDDTASGWVTGTGSSGV